MLLRKQDYGLEQVLKENLQNMAIIRPLPPHHHHHHHTSFTKNSVVLRCLCQPTYMQTSQGEKTPEMKASVQMAISIKLVLRMGLVVSGEVARCKCVQKPPGSNLSCTPRSCRMANGGESRSNRFLMSRKLHLFFTYLLFWRRKSHSVF